MSRYRLRYVVYGSRCVFYDCPESILFVNLTGRDILLSVPGKNHIVTIPPSSLDESLVKFRAEDGYPAGVQLNTSLIKEIENEVLQFFREKDLCDYYIIVDSPFLSMAVKSVHWVVPDMETAIKENIIRRFLKLWPTEVKK